MSVSLPPELARLCRLVSSARLSTACRRSHISSSVRGSRRGKRLLQCSAIAAGLLSAAAGAHAQASFGPVAIGASSTVTVPVTAQAAGTVKTVEVLTAGNSGLDFAAASGGACANANLLVSQQCTQPVTFSPAYPGARIGAVVLLDGSRNVLGTTYLSGSGSGGLGLFIPGVIQTNAGDGNWKGVGDGNPATSAELFLPSAVALDGVGNLYIADSNHNRIRMVCAGTTATIPGTTCTAAGIISTVAGVDGTAGYSGDGGPATSASVAMNTPSGLAIDGAGNLYIADTGNNAIREISAVTGIITTIAGTGTQGSGGDGGPAVSAKLNQPDGVAFDNNGNLYIADTQNNRVRAICGGAGSLFGASCAARGDIVTVAGTGVSGPAGDGGQAIAAQLDAPFTLAFDAAGNMFIADSGNSKVRAVCASSGSAVLGTACSAAGAISTVAGDGAKQFAGDGGPANSASLNAPSGLVFDPAGNLYIADTQNLRIRKVSAANGTILTVGGNGSAEYGGDGGPATEAGLYGPYGLALDGNGNLYIAELLDNRVRMIQSNLALVTEADPVRQGDTSPTTPVTVENDGSSTLTLTTLVAGTNTEIDPAVTTCTKDDSLAVNQQCVVGAIFAPPATPALSGEQAETGDIDVNDNTVSGIAGSNSPLVIQVTGVATPVNSTDVALTSSPNPSTFGQSVNFMATVTTGPNTGALTGTVTFYDGATKLNTTGIALNTNGTATFTTMALTVGTHSITAAYSGDSGHFAGKSAALNQVVDETTATTLASSANPSALNQTVTFTATVTAHNGGVTPDGTVTFMDGTVALGTVTLSAAGTATYSAATLADGLHSITAEYSGDAATYVQGSTSNVVRQDVLAGSMVTVSSAPNPSSYGIAVTFTATVTVNGTIAPTGTVNFLDGANTIGSATLAGTSGVAAFSTSSLAVGSHSITAAYVGNTNDGPGTSAPVTQVVNPADTTTTVSATPSPGIAGKAIALTATVAVKTGSAAVTGTVTFTDGTATLGTAKVGGNGVATLNQVFAPGVHTIVAGYGGDSNDHASASAALSLTVNQATTTVALTTSGTPAQVISAVTFKAAVSGNGGTPGGTVSFVIDGAGAGSSTLDSTGTAKFSDSALAVGSHTVVANYAGDTDDAASASSTLTQVITAIPTTTDLGVTSTGGAAPQTILVATTFGTTGPVPTGTIVFKNGTAVVGSAALDASGVATLIPDLAPGTYKIVASYDGDAVHGPSASVAVTVTGTAMGFSVAVDPPSMTLVSGQNGTITVTLASESGFSDSIGMGCLSLPAAVNCHFSSNTVKLGSGQRQTVQLTIDTNNPLSGGQSASAARPGGRGLALAGLFLPCSLFFGGLLWRLRRRHAGALVAALALFAAGALALTGCGAGFTQVSAAPGTYTIQVGGIGTGSNTSHYQNVTLTVTK